MITNNPASHMASQRGAALIVALVILLMVSLLGLSAMRSSIFSNKVATGIQADAMTFEAAETAISVAYSQLAAMTDQQLYSALDSGAAEYCVKTGSASDGPCASSDFMDERGLLKSQSYSYLAGYQAIPDSQVSVTGSSGVFVDFRIDMLGQSEMPSYKIENHHLQETLKRGIKPGSDIE